jgi:hypothetical protein
MVKKMKGETMDLHTFAVAVQQEENAYKAVGSITRMMQIAEFDEKMCFGDEENARAHFNAAAQKLAEANKMLQEGTAELMSAYASLKSATYDERRILTKYARHFLN